MEYKENYRNYNYNNREINKPTHFKIYNTKQQFKKKHKKKKLIIYKGNTNFLKLIKYYFFINKYNYLYK